MARMISFVKTPKPNYKIKTQRVSNANGIGQVMSRYGIMTFMSSDTGRISGAFVKPGLKKEIAYFYTAQKFRARFKREDYDNAPVKAKRVAYAFDKRNNQLVHKVRDSYWEVTVYGFPLDQIITGVQKSRSFKVTLKVNGG